MKAKLPYGYELHVREIVKEMIKLDPPEEEKCTACEVIRAGGLIHDCLHTCHKCCHGCSVGGLCEKQDGAQEEPKYSESSFIERKIEEFREKLERGDFKNPVADIFPISPVYLEQFLRTALEDAENSGQMKCRNKDYIRGHLAERKEIEEMIESRKMNCSVCERDGEDLFCLNVRHDKILDRILAAIRGRK